ncbi:hypothetical protein, partial [Paenibacillus sp. ISL-20]|uniref:hypothetical protein n=1 Tax=Paenibacillus sp. ISL-20 TaxID=2819163 RepID=UPI001BE7B09C
GSTSILPKNGFFASKKVRNLHGVAERTNRFRTSVSARLCPHISSLLRTIPRNVGATAMVGTIRTWSVF